MSITKADISGPVIEENANSSTSDNSTVKKKSNTKKNTNTRSSGNSSTKRSSGNNSETRKAKMRNTNLNLHYQNWEAIQKMYNLPDPEPPKTPKPYKLSSLEGANDLPPGLGIMYQGPIYENLKPYQKRKTRKVSKTPKLNTIKESSNEPPALPRKKPRRNSPPAITQKKKSSPPKPIRQAPKPPTSTSTQGSTSKVPRRKVSNKSKTFIAFKGKGKGKRGKTLKKKKLLKKKFNQKIKKKL